MLKGVTSAWLHGLAATSIALLFLAVSPGSPVVDRAVEVTAVVLELPERPALWARHMVSEGASWVGGVRRLQGRVRSLERENARLRATLEERSELRVTSGSGLVPARIDIRPPALWWNEVRIDKGSRDGIEEGMPALQRGFLVGRVSRVFPDHSWVDILTSTHLYVPVVIDETRDLGVLAGNGKGEIDLLYIPEYKVLRPGMRISTALVSDILPAGIPVGSISEKEPDIEGGFRVYHVSPGADISVMDSLLIMTGEGRP